MRLAETSKKHLRRVYDRALSPLSEDAQYRPLPYNSENTENYVNGGELEVKCFVNVLWKQNKILTNHNAVFAVA